MTALEKWLKRNRRILNLRGIEDHLGVARGTMSYVVHEKRHIPSKYEGDVVEFMKSLRDSIDFALKHHSNGSD